MKCQLCDEKATRIADLNEGLIVCCDACSKGASISPSLNWEELEYMTEFVCPNGHKYEAHKSDNPTCPVCEGWDF